MFFETVLNYSPYDVKVPLPYGIDTKEVAEDFFFENFFVEYPEATKKLMINLQCAIEEEWINVINFVGPGRCGKTTFLKSFFRENNQSVCSYLNLCEKPLILENEHCFRNTVMDLLARSFDKDTASFLYQTYCNWKSNSLKDTHWHFFGDGNKLLEFIVLCNLITRDELKLNLIVELERIGFNTIELLTLHFLVFTANHLYEDRPLVFVFDNLEELNNKYLQTVHNTILQAFSNAQYYCEEVLRFPFAGRVTIILSLRQITGELLGINQLNDRVLSHWTRIVFSKECQADFRDILDARINFYNKQGNNNERE